MIARGPRSVSIAVCIAALLSSACSFIDDWGRFRTGTDPGQDAGLDGGTGDSGTPDSGPTCPATCDPSCAAAETCVVDGNGCASCQPSSGFREGDACVQGVDECGGDLECLGRCHRRCMSPDVCTDSRWPLCASPSGVPNEPGHCLGYECDPRDPMACPGNACSILGQAGDEVATGCTVNVGPFGEDEACDSSRLCQPAYACTPLATSGPSTCRRFCGSDADCISGRACAFLGSAVGGMLKAGGTPLGLCVQPCATTADCPTGQACDMGGFCYVP